MCLGGISLLGPTQNVVAQNFSLKTRLEVLLKFYMKIINGGTDPGGLLSNGKYPS